MVAELVTEQRDHFARSTAARAWQATIDAETRLEGLLTRMAAIERKTVSLRRLQHCVYCGEFSIGPVCRQHAELLEVDNLAPEKDSAA